MLDVLVLQEKVRALLDCPSLIITAKPEWGSNNPNHRQKMREEIARRQDNQLHSSISHCPALGGIVFSPNPIGIDFEVSDRAQWSVVHRVSNPTECSEAPDPTALWCAKEAAFKALRSYSQPSVISQISIGVWKKIDSQTEKFQLLNFNDFQSPHLNKGIIIKEEKVTLSFFIFYP
jgi:4'-phosphopantetheinyl transferase